MNIEIKKGNISDFFDSAKETAREIDTGRKITRKNTIWVEQIYSYGIKKETSEDIK